MMRISVCIAEMIAAQKLNYQEHQTSTPIFGIISNGVIWEFAMIRENHFTKEVRIYTIQDLQLLLSAIAYMFEQSKLELAAF